MNKPDCIIAGIDLGPHTENVVAYAAFFAAATLTRIKLLYVIDYLLTPPPYLASHIEEEKTREESEMRVWKSRIENAGVGVEYRIVLGRLHESFREIIEETSPALLVIGHKSHALRPSSSERLIKSLSVPMLVVRGRAAEEATLGSVSIRRVLCPVDFSENSGKAVSTAIELTSLFKASLHIVHIIPSYLIKEKWTVWKKLGEEEREKFDRSMHDEAVSKMRSLCKDHGIDGVGEIYQGPPAKIIYSVAEEKQCDLIVMGARGLSYLQSILVGSTTESVLKSSPCPVLIVH
jgi:nucleotide-binding universal stress UspA family protein